MRWQAIPSQAMHLHSWDEEIVVYNALSGDTHLLGWAAAHILVQLQRGPSDQEALIESLRQSRHANPAPDLSLHVHDILVDLQRLMLIEKAM
jgi:PqqD family protein of HPr-rel-A system